MKHHYIDATIQAAIDEACKETATTHEIYLNALDLKPSSQSWAEETPARLHLLKYALARLPEPPPPAVDGKTPGQVAFEVYNGPLPWSECLTKFKWERVASAVLAAFGGAGLEATIARAEKAEAEFACKNEMWENQMIVIRRLQLQVEELEAKPQLSILRPIAEAGEVPDGCVRVHGYYHNAESRWTLTTWRHSRDTFCADIRLPAERRPEPQAKEEDGEKAVPHKPDPYAELKSAHAAGRAIDFRFRPEDPWRTLDENQGGIPTWKYSPECYRIKPEPQESPPAAPWQPAVGDVVTLKSGGPKMTVVKTSEAGVKCVWFNEEERLVKSHSEALPTATLTPA